MKKEYRNLRFPPASPLPMMNVLMAEIIYSWFSFGLLETFEVSQFSCFSLQMRKPRSMRLNDLLWLLEPLLGKAGPRAQFF